MNKELGITLDAKVLIRGLNSTTVIRLIYGKTTCGKLKSELGVSRIMSSGKSLKNDHTCAGKNSRWNGGKFYFDHMK